MTLTTLEQEILWHLHNLAPPQQREVLAFVHNLSAAPVGVPGTQLLAFASSFESANLTALQGVIDADCGQVDLDEW